MDFIPSNCKIKHLSCVFQLIVYLCFISTKHVLELHVVSLNVPFPANYGGVIDIFYKIKALSEAGVRVHLHCFDYGRGPQPELDAITTSVTYYPRKTNLGKSISKIPYIVNSRSDAQLLQNLNKNDWPILFEGLHTTYYLNHPTLKNRIKIVRTHNIEHEYYRLLANQEHSVFKKFYYQTEALRLNKYESVLTNASAIASISFNDAHYFASKYGKTFYLPPFHPNSELKCAIGSSDFALYHGDLSVRENIEAALFLVNIFKNQDMKLVIAGRNPSEEILNSVKDFKQFSVIGNPTDKVMSSLLNDAHMHVLPTFQPTGIKLKLINSLYTGRHCIVNSEMVKGTGLEQLCHIADTPDAFISKINKLRPLPFEDKDLIVRKEVLSRHFNNTRNVEILINELEKLQTNS